MRFWCLAGLIGAALPAIATSQTLVTTQSGSQFPSTDPANPILHVGILQRFGEELNSVNVVAPAGTQLNLAFAGQTEPLTTSSVTIAIVNEALTSPELYQRLVLGSHKSFETAFANAQEWEAQGIDTRVAQPGEWQVWADPWTYTPEQQQVLFSMIPEDPRVRFVQEERTERPQLSWVVGNYRYHRDTLTITSDAGYMQVGQYTYAGPIQFQPNAYGTYSVVNQVPIETYLRGVVPHEIGPGAPPNAIEAQAILARTYALRNTHRFEVDNYHLCATTHCQVYRGLTGTIPLTDAAIQRTAGQVLTYNGGLIDAVYSSTNGGISAAFEDIWDGETRPYLRSMTDIAGSSTTLDLSQPEAFRQFLAQTEGYNEAGISKFFRWNTSKSIDELTQLFRDNEKYLGIPLPEWTQIAGLKVLSRAPSGRVQQLQIDLATDSGPYPIILEKDQIRLGIRSLLSIMFDIEPIYQNEVLWGYTFTGGGFGHGVGMSQYGSYGLAKLGYTATQILDFYYPGAQLSRLGSVSYNLPILNPS